MERQSQVSFSLPRRCWSNFPPRSRRQKKTRKEGPRVCFFFSAYVAGMLSLRCGHLLRSRLRRDCEALTAQATSISSEGGMKDLDLKSLASQTQRVAQGTKQLVLGVELLERAHHSAEALPSLSFQLPPFGFGTSFGENLCLVVEELLNGL
eukprot:c19898_g1_i4.p2 GENE.c19898_g1_i4~~c19898_g1_i4.p2  ORF type:complete len:151 (+),score=12.88 c19898_g1_i4:33-485(+)